MDAFSSRGYLVSIQVSVSGIVNAIAGIEHKMDCEIMLPTAKARDAARLLEQAEVKEGTQ